MSKTKILKSELLYEGKWLTLKRDYICKPDGSKATHEILLRNNGVIIIVRYKENFLLTRMYRYPVDANSWEFPMGFIDVQNSEEPKDAAKREVEEETGFRTSLLEPLGEIWAWSGLMNQKIYVFEAKVAGKGIQKLDDTEQDLIYEYCTKKELEIKIKNNEIKNSATLAAYQLWNSKHEEDTN